MTTLDELVAADPAPSSGRPTDIPAGAGAEWRFGVWLADPEAGSSVVWHDITGYVTGVTVHHGAEQPHGSPRASWAELALRADDDRFATWNSDTSATFGTHVRLGSGLLIRCGLFRVAGSAVTHNRIRFTGRVEQWRGSSAALGRIRRHRVVVRDLSVDLTRTKLPADTEHSLTSRIAFIAGYYPFGLSLYCADTLDEEAVLTFPASDPYPSASVALDDTAMPGGLVWYVNRRGRLIMRPQIGDTWHDALIGAGATGTLWVDPALTIFSWAPSIDGGIAYVVEPDDGSDPFDIDDDEQTVRNDIDITVPDDLGYQVDDAGSIDRYGVASLPMTWAVRNDQAADDLLARLAYASRSARPLIVNQRDTGFTQALALNWGDPVMIRHTSRPVEGRAIVEATGRCRRTIDEITPLPGGRIRWRLSIDVDVDATEATNPLLPPEGLHVETLSDGYVLFNWSNPSQDPAPTVTQVRMIGVSTHWLEVGYPLTAFSWLYLHPDTPYRFEVRYLRVVDGLVTAVSPAATVDFTTPEPDDEPLTPPWEGGDPPVECTTAPALEEAPFDDESLIVFAPLWCPPDKIVEAVTELEATPGPALAGFRFDDDDNVALITDTDAGPVVYGESPLLEGINAGDLAIGCDVTIGDQDTTTLFEAGGLRIGAELWGDGWRPRAVAYTAVGESLVTGDELDLDVTYRIMASWERSTGTLKLYVAGELANETSAEAERELVNALPVWWAALPAASSITNCAVWATATPGRSGEGALYAAIMALGPVGYWPLWEESGDALDHSGGANDGVHRTGNTHQGAAGEDGRAYLRVAGDTGTNAGVRIPSSPGWQIGAEGLSVIVLANPDSGQTSQSEMMVACAEGDATTSKSWEFRLFNGIRPGFSTFFSAGGNTARLRTATSTVDPHGVWRFYMATVESTTAFPLVYVDGAQPATSTAGTGTAENTQRPLTIGYWNNNSNNTLTGGFAHVAVFPFVLSSGQIADLIAAAIADGWTL